MGRGSTGVSGLSLELNAVAPPTNSTVATLPHSPTRSLAPYLLPPPLQPGRRRRRRRRRQAARLPLLVRHIARHAPYRLRSLPRSLPSSLASSLPFSRAILRNLLDLRPSYMPGHGRAASERARRAGVLGRSRSPSGPPRGAGWAGRLGLAGRGIVLVHAAPGQSKRARACDAIKLPAFPLPLIVRICQSRSMALMTTLLLLLSLF